MKNTVSGVAGAARVYQLTNADLRKAERHGKREDAVSKARAIYETPCLTTTGLDLRKLHREHIGDAFVPTAKAKAMHVIIQFPKDLVDGEDGEYMLKHARSFVEKVFGKDAIFADRVDRDERGRHNVDIFIVPKYQKKTKHTSRLAVTMSLHQKALAKQYGRHTGPRGTGQAMQDAIYAYFRDDMKLEGVERGTPKLIAGPDWKEAEKLRQEELDASQAELKAREAREQEREARNAERQERIDSELKEAMAEKQAAEVARATAEKLLQQARVDADAIRGNAEAERSRQEAEDREARDRMASQQQAVLNSMLEAQTNLKDRQLRAEESQRDLDDAMLALKAERKALSADRLDVDIVRLIAEQEQKRVEERRAELDDAAKHEKQQQQLAVAQMNLLARASDDKNGLNLRTNGNSFAMDEEPMTAEEIDAYQSPWSKALAAIARRFALILEKIREKARRLAEREQKVVEREKLAEEQALRAHQMEREKLTQREEAVHAAENSAAVRATELAKREAENAAAVNDFGLWGQVVTMVTTSPQMFDLAVDGSIALSHKGRKQAEPTFAKFLTREPPAWVKAIVKQQRAAALSAAAAVSREKVAQDRVRHLKQVLQEAGPVLTAAQERAAQQVKTAINQHYIPRDVMER